VSLLLDRFFRGIYIEQAELVKKKLSERSQQALFSDQLEKTPRWPKRTIALATKALEDDLNATNPEFSLRSEIKAFLASHMCASADENSACSQSILVKPDHVRDFLYDLVCACAAVFIKVPNLFDDTIEFLPKRKNLEYLYTHCIHNCLIDFVQRYRHQLEEAIDGDGGMLKPKERRDREDDDDNERLEQPYVASVPPPTQFGPHMGGLGPLPAAMAGGMDGFGGIPKMVGEEESHEDEGGNPEAEAAEAPDPEPSNEPEEEERSSSSSSKKDETEEERRERHRQEDLEDKEIAEANQVVKFRPEVEIAPFEKEQPPKRSLLKPYNAPLIDESQTHTNESSR